MKVVTAVLKAIAHVQTVKRGENPAVFVTSAVFYPVKTAVIALIAESVHVLFAEVPVMNAVNLTCVRHATVVQNAGTTAILFVPNVMRN